jgi:hypothetical protein
VADHEDPQPSGPARDERGRWLPGGESPNPSGRPKGLGWTQQMRQRLRDESALGVLSAMHRAALGGDTQAAKLLLERVLPPMRSGDDEVHVPNAHGSIADKARAVAAQIVDGTLAPAVGADILAALQQAQAVVDAAELAQRVADLEQRLLHDRES